MDENHIIFAASSKSGKNFVTNFLFLHLIVNASVNDA